MTPASTPSPSWASCSPSPGPLSTASSNGTASPTRQSVSRDRLPLGVPGRVRMSEWLKHQRSFAAGVSAAVHVGSLRSRGHLAASLHSLLKCLCEVLKAPLTRRGAVLGRPAPRSGPALMKIRGFAPEPPDLSPGGEPPGSSPIGRPPHAAYPEPAEGRKAKPYGLHIEPCDPAQNPGVDKLSDRRKWSPHNPGALSCWLYYSGRVMGFAVSAGPARPPC